MLAEWSAECAADDPVLVVPWDDPDGSAAFVDLRLHPYDFDRLPEAEQYPALMQALRALNAPRSPVFTAKCDVWLLSREEIEVLKAHLDLPLSEVEDAVAGFGSYIDLLWRERAAFASFHQLEQQMHRLKRAAGGLHHPYAALECVVRPAFVDLAGPQEGFAVSLYIRALGPDGETAMASWADALDAVVLLLRSRELSVG